MALFDRFRRNQEPARSIEWSEADRLGERRFGYKTCWLAVRTDEPEQVVRVLGLVGVEHVPWPIGVSTAYKEGIFVSPPVEGWTLAMGMGVLLSRPDTVELSRVLETDVQYFGSHRVVDAYVWEWASGGAMVRSFDYCGGDGEIYRNMGEVTDAEREHDRLVEVLSISAGAPVLVETYPNEDTPMEIAQQWSVNPQTFSDPDPRLGWYGRSPS